MSKYSKINFIYFLQKWMDSVPGQTFLNYAYSWGAAVVILGTLFKLTHLPGANIMLFLGMGTEVVVFFISAFDRPFDKSTIDMALDNHMSDNIIDDVAVNPLGQPAVQPAQVNPAIQQHPYSQPSSVSQPVGEAKSSTATQPATGGGAPIVVNGANASGGVTGGNTGGTIVIGGDNAGGSNAQSGNVQSGNVQSSVTGIPASGTIIIGGGSSAGNSVSTSNGSSAGSSKATEEQATTPSHIDFETKEGTTTSATQTTPSAPQIITPAPAVSQETAAEMEVVTKAYIERLAELNEMLEKVGQLTSRLSTDSEEMENLNRTLTGIARVYEMQLKSASQQITTQDSINEQTRIMAQKIQELNNIYTRMIEAMTVNMKMNS